MTKRTRPLLLAQLLFLVIFPLWAEAAPVQLRINALTTPLGLDTATPVFSWRSEAKASNWMQTAYQVLMDPEERNLQPGHAATWDSGKVFSSESVNIRYAGLPLLPQTRYAWKVITWDNHGRKAESVSTWFETGLMHPSDWQAQWIRRRDPLADTEFSAIRWIWLHGEDAAHVPSAAPAQFRYLLHEDEKPVAASLHVLARGEFTASVNGQVSGRHVDWGAFDQEDITSLLHPGDNTITIAVVAHRSGGNATSPAAMAAAIHITHPDGSQDRLVSGSAWKSRPAADAPWSSAGIAGVLQDHFGLGTDREQPIPGPDRIITDASLLRKDFQVGSSVRQARLTITALGAYHAFLNGHSIAPDTLLAPGWTDFHKRVQYQTYDVTPLLQAGANTIGVELGGGWHSSPLTWSGFRYTPGPDLLRAQLDVTLANGQHTTVVTDPSWQTAPAPITSAEIYGGEAYDARLQQPGWTLPGFNTARWTEAENSNPPDKSIVLSAQPDLPINTVLTLHPVHLAIANAEHPAIFDMGQNMVGNVRLHVQGTRGTVVRLRYAERLNDDGSIYTANLRNADATDTYTLAGDGEESWSPSFTFHGFRYVEVSSTNGTLATPPTLATIEGLVYNSLPPAPSVRLRSSSTILNKMNELGAWGQRGNYFSIPTDCPQRDERLGWMGDAGVFWRTGSYNFDIDAFSHKFMLDVTDAQTSAGAFTNVSPNILGPAPGAPGWGDAGIFIPFAAWTQYGDLDLVERSWPAMERWMAFILANNPDFLRRNALGNNYGDWLAPDPHTPNNLIGTAYWALIAQEMAAMARALQRPEDASTYQQLYEHIAAAYQQAYIKPDGSVEGNTQTAYLATIFTGMAPPATLNNMLDRLTGDVQAHGGHLTTGFLGTPFLLQVLDEHGHSDLAFKLLLSDTYPSWGYMVKKGATTWWERWNGDTGDPSMNSYNHYAFGSVMAWVYRRAAGIDTDATGPGFHHLYVEPHFDAALPHLHVEYDSMYGTITSDWDGSQHTFTLSIPPNTSATVVLPGRAPATVGSGTHRYRLS